VNPAEQTTGANCYRAMEGVTFIGVADLPAFPIRICNLADSKYKFRVFLSSSLGLDMINEGGPGFEMALPLLVNF